MDKKSLWILISIIVLLVVAVAGYYFMRNDVRLSAEEEGNCAQCLVQLNECEDDARDRYFQCLEEAREREHERWVKDTEWLEEMWRQCEREGLTKDECAERISAQRDRPINQGDFIADARVCKNNALDEVSVCIEQSLNYMESCEDNSSLK